MKINIAITILDIVTKPSKFENHINNPGNIPMNKIIKLDKIQTNEYLTGILPFFKTIKIIINNKIATITNPKWIQIRE